MTERDLRRRPARTHTAVAVAGASAALLLVAAGSRAGAGRPAAPPGWRTVSTAASEASTVALLAVLPVAAAAGVAVLLIVQLMGRRRRDELEAAGLRRRPGRFAKVVAVATLVAAAWLIQRGSLHIPTTALERLRSLTGSHPSATPHTGGHTTAGSSVGTGEWVAAGVIWVLLAIAAATWWLRRPRVEPAAARVAEPAAAEAPPASTIEDVRAEPDPARAVIGAYALMERLLGDSGHGRRPSEAPLEYLHRVGGELPAASPAAAAITRLYLRARFAGRAVDRSAKAEAVAALERLAGAGSAP